MTDEHRPATWRERAEDAEAALAKERAILCRVVEAANTLVMRLAEVNLVKSNSDALGAALAYGPEVAVLQDALGAAMAPVGET